MAKRAFAFSKFCATVRCHTIKEIDVTAMLNGDFATSYTAGDNTKVVPTDTIKNTINVLAKNISAKRSSGLR